MNVQLRTQAKAQAKSSFIPAPSRLLQRKCACGHHTIVGGECTECQKKRLQRRAATQAESTEIPPIVHDVLRSPGQPLDLATRTFFEPRFGHDFSQVRVHTDAKAVESARAVNALAYTVGQDVVFGKGQYAPGTGEGQRLMAHELTHVVQQALRVSISESIGFRGVPYEREANRASSVFSSGQYAMIRPVTSVPFLQRQAEPEEADLESDISPPPVTGTLDDLLRSDEPAVTPEEILELKQPQKPANKADCHNGKVLRWGCDTVCSHNGFWDIFMVQSGGKPCCNMWPPFVEDYARKQLKLNGTASCRGASRRSRNQIATATAQGKSVEVLCTDAFSGSDHEIELSPLAMQDLHRSFENIPKARVCYRDPDSSIETCKEPHAKRGSQEHPQEDDCVSKGCQSIFDKNNRKSCSDFGWPNN